MAHRTERGAWTKAQVEAVGLKWKDTRRRGWHNQLLGKMITDEQRKAFEVGNHSFSKRTLKNHRKQNRVREDADRAILADLPSTME